MVNHHFQVRGGVCEGGEGSFVTAYVAVSDLSNKHPVTVERSFTFDSERARRIELPSSAWKAEVLPLNYARKFRFLESTVLKVIANSRPF